jgi:hypothetical protein
MSLLGEVTIKSSYYRCDVCRKSQQPWALALRLTKRRVTAAAEEAIALAGLLTSFDRAARQTLRKLTGMHVSESTVRRVTEDAGERLKTRQANREMFGPEKSWDWRRDARGKTCGYAGMDHVSVPQQGPGGAKAESRMAAVSLIYNPPREEDRPQPRQPSEVRLVAGFYELDALGRTLRRQASQVGWNGLEQQLAVSDAGKGLEDVQRKHFSETECILDFFHVSEHVTSMAQAVQPRDPEAARQQAQTWRHALKRQGGPALRRKWEQIDTSGWGDDRRETYRKELQYFVNHEHKMDYPRYLANGWQIGSGPVESACKRVVTQRLKGAGMRWGERGSDAVCHLNALLLSQPGCWDHFWTPSRHLQN